MMKRILLSACAVILMAGFATAQTAPTPPPPVVDQQIEQPDDKRGWGKWWGHGRHNGKHDKGRNGHGKRHAGGRHDMKLEGKGLGIMVGPGHGLRINCGDETMKDCIAAAQPLIDALGKMPPPPAAAVAPAQ